MEVKNQEVKEKIDNVLKDAVCALYVKEGSSEISRFLYIQLMTMKVQTGFINGEVA